MDSVPDDRTLRAIPRVAELIASADALLITASAGMGVDSGLPDFRGKDGFWRAQGLRQQLHRQTKLYAELRILRGWGRAAGRRLRRYVERGRAVPGRGFRSNADTGEKCVPQPTKSGGLIGPKDR